MGLGGDERPVRFAIVTSVVSGLTVAAMTAGAGRLLDARLLVYRVPLWVLVSLLPVAVVFSALGAVLLRERRTQVFFVLCAFSGKRWVADLVQNLHDTLDAHQLDLVVKIPKRDCE